MRCPICENERPTMTTIPVKIVTVQIVVPDMSDCEVADYLSETLRDVLDWSYLKLGSQWLHATEGFGLSNENGYIEGSAFGIPLGEIE